MHTTIQPKRTRPTLQFGLALWLLMPAAYANADCEAPGKHVLPVQLKFLLTHSQMPGQLAETEHQLNITGNRYQLQAKSTAKGLLALMFSGQLTQNSEGIIDPKEGLNTLQYTEQRGKKAPQETTIDPNRNVVTFKKQNLELPFTGIMHDRLNMLYQLSSILRCQPTLKTGHAIHLNVLGSGRWVRETFTIKHREPMQFILNGKKQTIETTLLETKPEDPKDEMLRVWFGKNLNWHPVQIQIQDAEHKTLTQTLVKLIQLD